MVHIWTMLMHKILQNHLLCAFVANLKIDAIYALYPESFCYKNLAIRKVFAFCDSDKNMMNRTPKTSRRPPMNSSDRKRGGGPTPNCKFPFFWNTSLSELLFCEIFLGSFLHNPPPPPKKKKCVISILHLSLLKAILVALKEVAIGSVHPSMVEKITCFQNTSMYGFPHF